MRILLVLPYSPVPATYGSTLRILNLMKQMVRRHDLSVVYFGHEGSERAMADAFGGRLRRIVRVPRPWNRKHRRLSQLVSLFGTRSHFSRLGRSDLLAELLGEEAASGRYDAIQTEFPHMVTDLDTGLLRVLDTHNVEYHLIRRQWEQSSSILRRLHYGDEWRKMRREEIAAWTSHDLVFATSDRDRRMILEDAPGTHCAVVPNGVDSDYFAPSGGPEEPDSIVFTGMMKYLPNHDGIGWFLDEILPLVRAGVPGVRLTVVGADPPAHLAARAGAGVTITGRVEDVRPWVDRAAVSIVPLRMGGGTRLKICEAFSMRKPVVSTTIGAEGIEAVHGESIMIADEPRAFADAIVRLLRDARLRRAVAGNGYELMRTRYEWSVVGGHLEEAYRDALARRGRGVRPHAVQAHDLPSGRGGS